MADDRRPHPGAATPTRGDPSLRPLRPDDLVVHSVGTWVRIESRPSGERDNRALLSRYLAEVLRRSGVRVHCAWPVPAEQRRCSDLRWRDPGDALEALPEVLAAAAPRPDEDSWQAAQRLKLLELTAAFTDSAARAALSVLWESPGPTGEDPPVTGSPSVVLHVRFLHYGGRLHVHLGLSLWVRPAPTVEEAVRQQCTGTGGPAVAVIERLKTIGLAWQRAIERTFWVTSYELGDTVYRPPSYWFVSARLLTRDRDLAVEVRHHCLGVRSTSATSVDAAVVNHRYQVWRRVHRDHTRRARPLYLIAPLTQRPPWPRLESTASETWRGGRLIRVLNELEGRLAWTLWENQRELELDVRLLLNYQSAATTGTALWDRLAMHLTSARGSALDRAHKQILLVHQTVLQSVSDLQDIAKHIDDTSDRIDESVAAVERRFDEELTEELTAEGTMTFDEGEIRGLRLAIVGTGLSEHVLREAERAQRLSAAVGERTQTLCSSVTSALNDRRARESDVLQRATVYVVGLAAALAFGSSVLAEWLAGDHEQLEQSALAVAPNGLALFSGWLPALAVLIAGVVTLVVLAQLQFLLHRGRSMGRRRRLREFDETRAFLAGCSSPQLDSQWRLALAAADASAGQPVAKATVAGRHSSGRERERTIREHWDNVDRAVAERFAALWDRSCVRHYSRHRPQRDERGLLETIERTSRTDLNRLEDEVGRWAIQSLLLTERPRRFDEYHLPRLCLLYRYIRAVQHHPPWVTAAVPTRSRWLGTAEAPVTSREVVIVLMRTFPGLSATGARTWQRELSRRVRRHGTPSEHGNPIVDEDRVSDRSSTTNGAGLSAVELLRFVEDFLADGPSLATQQ